MSILFNLTIYFDVLSTNGMYSRSGIYRSIVHTGLLICITDYYDNIDYQLNNTNYLYVVILINDDTIQNECFPKIIVPVNILRDNGGQQLSKEKDLTKQKCECRILNVPYLVATSFRIRFLQHLSECSRCSFEIQRSV